MTSGMPHNSKAGARLMLVIILFVDLLVMTSCHTGAPGYIMWVGMTQRGKSSCIKLLTGNENIKCGEYPKGKSTTS